MSETFVVKEPDGSLHWLNEHGRLHNENGPAIVYQDGTCMFFRRGIWNKTVKPDGTKQKPDLYLGFNTDQFGCKRYCNNLGNYDYPDPDQQEPAVVLANGDKYWYYSGYLRAGEIDGVKYYYDDELNITKIENNVVNMDTIRKLYPTVKLSQKRLDDIVKNALPELLGMVKPPENQTDQKDLSKFKILIDGVNGDNVNEFLNTTDEDIVIVFVKQIAKRLKHLLSGQFSDKTYIIELNRLLPCLNKYVYMCDVFIDELNLPHFYSTINIFMTHFVSKLSGTCYQMFEMAKYDEYICAEFGKFKLSVNDLKKRNISDDLCTKLIVQMSNAIYLPNDAFKQLAQQLLEMLIWKPKMFALFSQHLEKNKKRKITSCYGLYDYLVSRGYKNDILTTEFMRTLSPLVPY